MKILLIGFFIFSGWSTLSTYIYVCKIKGLCFAPLFMQIGAINQKDVAVSDTLSKPLAPKQAVSPKDLTTYFAFDKFNFSSDAGTEKYSDELKKYLDHNSQARLRIIGHTDAIGTNEYNQALGFRRAQSMQHYFEKNGLPADKIMIESKGENNPADDNITTAGRANNRRSTISIKN